MHYILRVLLFLIPISLFASKPQLLLLETYKDQNISGWVMSEKLDGVRAYWDGKKLISRGGKNIHAPKWFIKDFPAFEIDGELWTKRGDFENISSIVRNKNTKTKRWKTITYNIFEVPNAKGNLYQRLEKVKPYENDIIKIIPQIKIKNKKHLKSFLKNIDKNNGEGVVVRDPKALYINKRTSKALKVKSFKDAECKVVGYTKGRGKFKNLMGAVVCELENKIVFKIGSGFTLQDRKYPPKIGSLITFKYQSFTKNQKPRFPIFLRIRYKSNLK